MRIRIGKSKGRLAHFFDLFGRAMLAAGMVYHAIQESCVLYVSWQAPYLKEILASPILVCLEKITVLFGSWSPLTFLFHHRGFLIFLVLYILYIRESAPLAANTESEV